MSVLCDALVTGNPDFGLEILVQADVRHRDGFLRNNDPKEVDVFLSGIRRLPRIQVDRLRRLKGERRPLARLDRRLICQGQTKEDTDDYAVGLTVGLVYG